ncbi:MAG: translocation/assembly module TamB domain-containing protein [Pseudohongiellaceae bacterium]
MTKPSLVHRKIVITLLKTVGVISAFVLACLSLVSIVVLTDAGSRWIVVKIVERAKQASGAETTWSRIEGNLFRGLELSQVEISSPSFKASGKKVSAAWNPFSVLQGSFVISELVGSGIEVEQFENGSKDGAASQLGDSLNVLEQLPIEITIDTLGIETAVFESAAGRTELESMYVSVTINEEMLLLENLELNANSLNLQGELAIELKETPSVDAKLHWEYEDSSLEYFEFTSGQFAATGNLDTLSIEHELLAPIRIFTQGTLQNFRNLDAVQAQLDHTAEEFSFPLEGKEPVLFRDVNVNTQFESGKLAWEFRSQVSQAQYPEMAVSGNGDYVGGLISLATLSASSDSGSAQLSGAVELSDRARAELELAISESDPDLYFELPSGVDLTGLQIEGVLDLEIDNGGALIIAAKQLELSGELNGNQLLGTGDFHLENGSYRFDQIQFAAAQSEFLLNGIVSEEIDLNWSFNVPTLAALVSGIKGDVSASGYVRGATDQPLVEAKLYIKELEAGPVYADSLSIELFNSESNLQGQASLLSGEFRTDSQREPFSEAQLKFQGSLDSQSIELNLSSDTLSTVMFFNGGAIDFENRAWNANLTQGEVTGKFGDWSNQEASSFVLRSNVATLDMGCWSSRDSAICVEGEMKADSTVTLTANLSNFPLDEFNSAPTFPGYMFRSQLIPKLPPEVFVSGPVGMSLQGELSPAGAWQGEFSLSATDTQLVVLGPQLDESNSGNSANRQHRYNWESLSLAGKYEEANWQLRSKAILADKDLDGSGFQLESVLESSLFIGGDESISGQATANFSDLGWIEAIVPEISAISGELISSFEISGSLNDPIIEGNASVSNGAFTADRFGVTFQDFESLVSGGKEGNAQIEGSVNSGEGQLSFAGSITDIYNSKRELSATVSGSNFEIIDKPDLALSLTPELLIKANSEVIDLSGRVDIPVLNLTVKELPSAAVNVSRDVVIVNYPPERPDLAKSLESENASLFAIPVTAKVNLNLGSDVSFTGFGLTAGLQGSLDIQQLATGNNLTYGELEIIDGSYELYRQSLQIRQGKLLFLGAYDNPGLDIRAVREVADITAGVQMNGTLRNIRSQLFSTPTLAESDIVSVLVTGRPFSQLGSQQDDDAVLNAITKFGLERGQGLTAQIAGRLGLDALEITSSGDINSSELSVGKYVTPGIFVRYGIGLFDSRSKMAVDYNLTEKLLLQAETGEFQSVDVTYKVEK